MFDYVKKAEFAATLARIKELENNFSILIQQGRAMIALLEQIKGIDAKLEELATQMTTNPLSDDTAGNVE